MAAKREQDVHEGREENRFQRGPEDTDSALDMLSDKFDPLKALYAREEDIKLPYPNVQAMDNLAQYEAMVRGTASKGPKTRSSAQDPCSSSTDAIIPTEGKTPASSRGSRRTVVDFMREPHLNPFHLLKTCVENVSLLYVWTRHISGIRGILRGNPLLFDHHFNLLLSDVWEVYLPFCESKRKNKRKRKRRRNRIGKELLKTSNQKQLDSQGQQQHHHKQQQEQQQLEENQQQQQQQQQHKELDIVDISSSDSEGSGGHLVHLEESDRVSNKGTSEDECPMECRPLLELFRTHCTNSKSRHLQPRWQHSKMLFIRGDSVVMVTNPNSSH